VHIIWCNCRHKKHQNALISVLQFKIFTGFMPPNPTVAEGLRCRSPNPTYLGTPARAPPAPCSGPQTSSQCLLAIDATVSQAHQHSHGKQRLKRCILRQLRKTGSHLQITPCLPLLRTRSPDGATPTEVADI